MPRKWFGSENIAKEWLYSEIFNYEYNYSFKSPDNDTCHLCDQLQLQIREAESPGSRKRLQTEYDQHLGDSNNRYKMKSEDKEKSRKNLLEHKSFYSLTIQDATCENSFCVMWDESVSGRGRNEVASCLIKWVEENVTDKVREITIWSDNCQSQNWNILIIMWYFYILHIKPHITTISHKFLARRHTHLEADAFTCRRSNPGTLYCTTDFNKEFSKVNFHRRNKPNDYTPLGIAPIRGGPKPISAKKYRKASKIGTKKIP
nr:unnamed protein product [Callosobruchus analis]